MAPRHPNILMLVVDCLRADACYEQRGGPPLAGIRALRARGVTFRDTIAVSSTTSPCFASLFTGVYPAVHGVRSLRRCLLDDRLPTLAETFAAAGYHTRAWVTGPLRPETRLGRGFHDYRWRDRRQTIHGAWGRELLRDLERTPRPPWLTVIHTFALHNPARRTRAFARSRYGRTVYDQAVCCLDDFLRRLLERVNLNDTLVVLTADHGEMVVDRHWAVQSAVRGSGLSRVLRSLGLARREDWATGRHAVDVSEEMIRIPLVLAGAGVSGPPRTVEAQISQADIMPTLAEIAGIPPPPGGPLRGISHAVAVEDPASVTARPVFSETREGPRGPLVSVRAGGWKYVCRPDESSDPGRLYDLRADPDERRNCAQEEPRRASELRRIIERDYLSHVVEPAATLSEEDSRVVERHLRELGYL